MPSIYAKKQTVVMPLDKPMHATGHIVILHGNLAPEGAVAKVAGLKVRTHHRPGEGVRRRGSLSSPRSRPEESSPATWS